MKSLSVQETIELLQFMYEMPRHRVQKCESLYSLAKNAIGGVIVELGTYHGTGTIALCYGTKCGNKMQVFTVDDYTDKHGWAGERYKMEDAAIMQEKLAQAQVYPVKLRGEVRKVSETFIYPISMLFWDLGMVNRLSEDIDAWEKHLVRTSVIVVHDTSDKKLGTDKLFDKYTFVEEKLGNLFVFKK